MDALREENESLRVKNVSLMESIARWSKVAGKQNEVMNRSQKLRSQNEEMLQTIERLNNVAESQSEVIEERGRLFAGLLNLYRETRSELDEMLAARATVSAKKVYKRKQPARKVKIERK